MYYFLAGMLTATGAIIAAQHFFDYRLDQVVFGLPRTIGRWLGLIKTDVTAELDKAKKEL